MSFVHSEPANSDSHEEGGRSWMVVKIHGQDVAVRSDCIATVYRTVDAARTALNAPNADIEVHGGRPWFMVSPRQIFLTLDDTMPSGPNEWTEAFAQPAGVAIHVESIEGPYRGVVMQDTLRTPQGTWPILRPLR